MNQPNQLQVKSQH